ncbi:MULTISPECIES: MarR family winged helix-turn-helix transcriptional regulator [Mumia]|uniref:MarR family winged helix-turn-helix transcriptional regulator n=1 Tax=Mumia TaxID=1546255 RepID=UPI00141FCEAF|nr:MULTISPECIES: MarR family transcriptional regulator [unclassified Mumia]QMW67045.1 MarR family transcriptional regulator [Mumia sp. ZJ1417]
MLTTETAERMVGVLGKLSRALRSSSHRWERLNGGMRRQDHTVLRRLQRHGEQRMSDLADAQCVTASVISRQIAALEQEGLVERRSDPADARVGLIRLSDHGSARLEDATRRYAGFVRSVFADWDDAEAARMADLINEFADRLALDLEHFEGHLDTDPVVASAAAAFDRTNERNRTS